MFLITHLCKNLIIIYESIYFMYLFCYLESRGGGGVTRTQIVLPTRVHHPIKWTLNGGSQHLKFATLNGVTVTLAIHLLENEALKCHLMS